MACATSNARSYSWTTDATLRVLKVGQGSIKIYLEGSAEGYRVLESLFRSGQLTSIFGLPIKDVSLDGHGESPHPEKSTPSGVTKEESPPYKLFFSYAHKDKKTA